MFAFFGKTIPYGTILKILFRKFSSRHRSTCCVQTSWNLAEGKSVKSCVAYLTTSSSSVADKPARRSASRQTAKILKQSHDHKHEPFVDGMSSCCDNWYSLPVHNLTTLGSAVPMIWLEPQNFVMDHMTWPRLYQGQFVVRMLWLPHSTFTSNLESLRSPITKMHKALKKVEIEVV